MRRPNLIDAIRWGLTALLIIAIWRWEWALKAGLTMMFIYAELASMRATR